MLAPPRRPRPHPRNRRVCRRAFSQAQEVFNKPRRNPTRPPQARERGNKPAPRKLRLRRAGGSCDITIEKDLAAPERARSQEVYHPVGMPRARLCPAVCLVWRAPSCARMQSTCLATACAPPSSSSSFSPPRPPSPPHSSALHCCPSPSLAAPPRLAQRSSHKHQAPPTRALLFPVTVLLLRPPPPVPRHRTQLPACSGCCCPGL